MTFTGAWRARQFTTDPPERLHTAGADHVKDMGDPNPTWNTPGDLDQVPEYVSEDYPEDAWLFADTTGVAIDMTDYQSHYAPHSPMTAPDEGASREAMYEPPVLQSHDERYLHTRFEGLTSSPVPTEALRRGLNGDPLNNPEGFRAGYVDQDWVDRKMYDPERVHDRRLNLPNTADIVADQPGQPVPWGNPFAGMARAITNVNQSPMIRREPPPISESVTTDGSEDVYDAYPEWVAG